MLPRRREVQRLSRSGVQAIRDLAEIGLVELRQWRPFREILPQQPVGILVGAALPGRVRVGEVDAHAGRRRQARVAGYLLALVVGRGLVQRLGGRIQRARKATRFTHRERC